MVRESVPYRTFKMDVGYHSMLKRNLCILNELAYKTGRASRNIKKKMARTKIIALTPLRRIMASSIFSPLTAQKDREGRTVEVFFPSDMLLLF
jgi:hypothetical protein